MLQLVSIVLIHLATWLSSVLFYLLETNTLPERFRKEKMDRRNVSVIAPINEDRGLL